MPKTILVAEDSATQRELIRADLEGAGYHVTVAADGEEALQRLGERHFDLLLSDVVMPGMSGYDLCREAKGRDGALPVVLLTSLSDPLDVVHGLQAGADNFLRKPYDLEQLLDRIETILRNRQLRENGQAQMGLELFFLKQRFMITAERQQILDLLVSTFEELVGTNERLREREEELARAHADLSRQLAATESERRQLNGVLAAMPQVMVTIDTTGAVTGLSDGAVEFFGAGSAENLHGRPMADLGAFLSSDGRSLPPDERPLHRAITEGTAVELGGSFDVLVQRPDGSRVPVLLRSAPLRSASGRVTGAVGVLQDLGALANHDPLTRLPTQAPFAMQVRNAVDSSARHGGCAAVLIVQLDRYQRIRESLGHADSDGLVTRLARRLQEALASGDVSDLCADASAAYLGNQEFAVALTGLDDDMDAVRVAELLVDRLGGIYTAEGIDVPLTLSVGVAVTTDPAAAATDLVPAAAAAAHEASAAGGDQVAVSDPDTSRRAAERLHKESALRHAIEAGELRVFYQPQIAIPTGEIVGMEALVRWQHPEHGLLSPAAFIDLAEESGLVVPLGAWVLREACRQMALWRRDVPGADGWKLSVNLAPQQLGRDDVTEAVRGALADSGLEPSALQLEITETGVMADPAAASARLAEMKSLGARVALDDFGTGYSSLVQLREMPIDVLKVDRAFVGDMTSDDEDAAIVAGTVRLGQALGLEVVAEGVETYEQLVRLRVLGCDVGQGYHWAPPLPAEELLSWSRRHVKTGVGGSPLEIIAEVEEDHAARDHALAYLVHELRSPLISMQSFVETLADIERREHPELSTALRGIERNLRTLDGRLRAVTDVQGARDGVMALELEECDLGELTRQLVEDARAEVGPRAIVVHAKPGLVTPVDTDRIAQALTNLLSNAAKFSPPDTPIQVTVSSNDEQLGSLAEVAVIDRGDGVPPERRSELFRRFSRLGSRTKGMGVGLYLSRLIARAHGGDIRYEPADGGGSRFVLSLPVRRESVSRAEPVTAQPRPQVHAGLSRFADG